MKKKNPWYKDEIRSRKKMSVHIRECTPNGCYCAEAIWWHNPAPIGCSWFQWVGAHTIELLSSYVINHYRRLGVRTFIHEEVLKAFPTARYFVSGEGTRAGGAAWMKATGFKKKDNGWWLQVNRKSK